MNDKERYLINYICNGNMYLAQQQARLILKNLSTKKDEQFRDNMLRKLDEKDNKIPANLQEFLIAEYPSNFPESRFILRAKEAEIVHNISSSLKASEQL